VQVWVHGLECRTVVVVRGLSKTFVQWVSGGVGCFEHCQNGDDQQLEQRVNSKFLVQLGKNGPEIHQMLQQVYGEYALKERTVFKWVQHFREGREDPKDDSRSGHPSTSSGNENIDRVRYLVLSDRRLTVRMIAEELALGKSSVHTILMEHLEMKKVCAKIIPELLTPE